MTISSVLASTRHGARTIRVPGLSGAANSSTATSVESGPTFSTRAFERRPRPSKSQISSPARTLAALARCRCSSPRSTIRPASGGSRGTKNWLAVTLLDVSLEDVLELVQHGLVDRFGVFAAEL